jgi:aryl-alcohol dehydrogenase-like predicted oxidoreductase
VERTTLGPLSVSRLALGAMLMGKPADAERLLDGFRAAGGNFIDTADVYGDGESERALAPWLHRHRDEVVVATKVRFFVSEPGGEGLAPARIRAACDASLRRLGIDVIDLYQVHAPDPGVPIEETLEALDGLVRAGKVRALGASNFPAWLLAWAVATQDREGWAPFVSLQAQYSLVERSVELELLAFCRAAGVGLLAWGPLGGGFLTGRFKRGEPAPTGSRIAAAEPGYEEAFERRAVERNFRVVDAASAIAASHQTTIPAVAIAWLLSVQGVKAPIIGPRTTEQLEQLLQATDLHLAAEDSAGLEHPAPPPDIYPHRMLRDQVGIRSMPALRRR